MVSREGVRSGGSRYIAGSPEQGGDCGEQAVDVRCVRVWRQARAYSAIVTIPTRSGWNQSARYPSGHARISEMPYDQKM